MAKETRTIRRAPRWATVVAGCAWALAAAAQTAPADSDAPPSAPGQVISDVQPLPAEDRDSHGAVVIEGAPVRAQQKQQQRQPQAVKPATIGRDAHTVLERNRSWDDVRDANAVDQLPAGEASGAGPAPAPTPAPELGPGER